MAGRRSSDRPVEGTARRKARRSPVRTEGPPRPKVLGTSRVGKSRKSAAPSDSPPRARTKVKRSASEAKPARARKRNEIVLLSGGNPQIRKADGDRPVQEYISHLPGWKRDLGKRLDALIVRSVPHVRKAVKWNSPLYGVEGRGWFLGMHAFTRYIKLTFFRGSSLRPLPPGPSKDKRVRYVDIHEDDGFDEARLSSWVKQAAALPGWDPGRPA